MSGLTTPHHLDNPGILEDGDVEIRRLFRLMIET